ncbi:MAG: exodeoxyribonuclease III [Alphaproteobacteria bacterium]|nr:exodeoxyribonuclease III [Alphaproteobacteria bacterium]
MTIVTWNVNSVRLRVPLIGALIEALAPDVLCLQETKVVDADFPLQAFAEHGFVHAALHGAKAYGGVAILSREPLAHIERPQWCGKADGRHVLARLRSGVEINCLYVPAGGDVPDPIANPKFAHKLRLLGELSAWFAARKAPRNRLVLTGDLNIAPLESDVWSHRALLKEVSHTPVEIDALETLRKTHDWIDAVRYFVPPGEPLYSWWSYRARDWEAANRGRRLDHVWVTPPLRRHLRGATILREARGWSPPSDHAPVAVTLAV